MEFAIYTLIELILWLFFALFACGEEAMLSLNEKKLEELSQDNEKAEEKLKLLHEKSSETKAALRLGSMFTGFLSVLVAVSGFGGQLTDFLWKHLFSDVFYNKIGIKLKVTSWLAILIIMAIVFIFISFVGYFIPKRLASQKAENVALSLYGLISFTAIVFKPLVKMHRALSKLMLKGVVSTDKKEDEVSADDIKQLVDMGNKTGTIDTEEKEIIQNIFEFNSTEVMEFCTHRTDMTVLWTEDSIEEWEKIIHETRHTLYPVCGESVDDVIGILNVKDYFALEEKTVENAKAKAIKPPFFVPQSMNADTLFKKMKQTRFHFAVVIDEYGGVFGIVTINDLLEQIVGELEEADGIIEEKEIEKIDDSHWKVLGGVSLADLEEELDVKLPTDDYVNFNGYVLASVGSIPDDGTKFEVDTDILHIEVSEINANKIEKAIVSVIEKEETEE